MRVTGAICVARRSVYRAAAARSSKPPWPHRIRDEEFELTPEYKADVAEVMVTILPVRPRADGAVFDMFISNADLNAGYPLEEIAVPVLIVSAVDDPLTLYANAKAAAERIPGARLVTIEDGGHMLLGHQEKVRSEIVAFLEEYASTGP